MQTLSPTSTASLKINVSPKFTTWLAEQQLSLAFTTYQTNRLFFIGCQTNGRLKIHERLFDKPMGLYARGEQLFMSTRYQIWQFENLLEHGECHKPQGHALRDREALLQADRLYIPRIAFTTGDVNIHDVALDESQNIVFVNTDFSCLATLDCKYSFVPFWQPGFIDKLVAEDRCHLNGMAMVDGKPAYVTACGATNTAAGWRNHRRDGGVVIDVEHNEIIATGLSMPHSPRWYKEKLWLLNSGSGELGYIDSGKFIPITFCPGFVRGLAFWGDFAVVGLSKLRSASFSDLALEERLTAEGNTSHCGLMVINLNTGQIVEWLHIGETVEELFDIVILPNVRQPEALGLQEDSLQRLVRFPNSGGIVTTKPTVKRPSIGKAAPVAGLPQPSDKLPIKYQRVYHLNPSNALAYDALTYPSLQQRWHKQQNQGELLGISAAVEGSLVGFAIAELINSQTAEIISLLVLPEYRKQGIGTKLLVYLEQELIKQNCQQLTLSYQSTSLTQTALERMLNKLQWQIPQTNGNYQQTFKSIINSNYLQE